MRNIKVLVFLIVILYIVSLTQESFLNSKNKIEPNIPNKIISPTVLPTETLTPIPSENEKLNQSAIPSPSPNFKQNNISAFIYPNSTKISSEKNSIFLESTDDSQAITNWYKEKITGMGVNAKSFVQTNTNGNVLNKLVGANGVSQVAVEISKQNSESKTVIKISVK